MQPATFPRKKIKKICTQSISISDFSLKSYKFRGKDRNIIAPCFEMV